MTLKNISRHTSSIHPGEYFRIRCGIWTLTNTFARHPNTLWVGVWTPKHLLRRLFGHPGIPQQKILLHELWFLNVFMNCHFFTSPKNHWWQFEDPIQNLSRKNWVNNSSIYNGPITPFITIVGAQLVWIFFWLVYTLGLWPIAVLFLWLREVWQWAEFLSILWGVGKREKTASWCDWRSFFFWGGEKSYKLI